MTTINEEAYRINFDGAPATQTAQSANISGHVEPGQYRLEIDSLELVPTRNNPNILQYVLRMHVLRNYGQFSSPEDGAGTLIIDRFNVPCPDRPSMVGFMRLHALLEELGIKAPGNGEFLLPRAALNGRKIDALITDDTMPANGSWSERTISRVELYQGIKKAPAPAAAPQPAKSAAVAGEKPARPAAVQVVKQPEPEPDFDGVDMSGDIAEVAEAVDVEFDDE